MNHKQRQNLKAILTSFIGMGIFIVLFVVGLVFFSYLLIVGGIIGLILFGIAYLRAKFFTHKAKKHNQTKRSHHSGRTIDHE